MIFKIYYAFGYGNIGISVTDGETIESQHLLGFGHQANWLEGITNIFSIYTFQKLALRMMARQIQMKQKLTKSLEHSLEIVSQVG